MRYDEKSGTLYIDAEEFITISRRRISRTSTPDAEERLHTPKKKLLTSLLPDANTERLFITDSLYGIKAEIFGTPDAVMNDGVVLVREYSSRVGKVPKYLEKQVRGELFLLGYMLAEKTGLSECTVTSYLCNKHTGDVKKTQERVEIDTLRKFFRKCSATVSMFARPECERVTERHKSMRELKFPFPNIREGQRELVRSVYRNLARGTHLFASAPTGTGKTVSVIYPALRAIGDGRIDKLFYLTPKTTAREAAIDCIGTLERGGLKIRAVCLIAKEKICQHKLVCREDADLCPENCEGKLAEAVMALYDMQKAVIGSCEILDVAQRYGVCSYELSLSYSELCDLIICDLNYVFDTSVYLQRYFDAGGKYGLLIDEAHNLVARAREMYSAEINTGELLRLSAIPEISASHPLASLITGTANNLYSLFYPYLKDNIRISDEGIELSAAYLSEIPSELYSIVYNFEDLLNRELLSLYSYTGADKAEKIKHIKKLYYDTVKLSELLDRFDEGYRLLLSLDGGGITVKLFCIDTGRVLSERLKKVSSAVFFSATLEPIDYYVSMLGGDASSDTINVHSCFDPKCLSVTIMDKISTRYSERERTCPAICRVIAATMSARRGHYMVFAPSFEYAEALYREFAGKYPKITAILQQRDMSTGQRYEFLDKFKASSDGYLVGFCVMGGIYSEGIDLVGESLIGAVVISIGMPTLSFENELIAEYYEDKLEHGKEYAYIYPGMNKVFQAAGRVIRREEDRGVIVLVDDRFSDPIYKKSIPDLWRGMRYCDDAKLLRENLDSFWKKIDKQ